MHRSLKQFTVHREWELYPFLMTSKSFKKEKSQFWREHLYIILFPLISPSLAMCSTVNQVPNLKVNFKKKNVWFGRHKAGVSITIIQLGGLW